MLPFTRDSFLDVFAAYNSALWPFTLALWATAALAFATVVWAPRRQALILWLLTVEWAWSGVAYHAVFFTSINPAAWLFAAMFLVEAVLLGVYAYRGEITFSDRFSPRVVLGWAVMAYALLYPIVPIMTGEAYPRMPTFGVPCPTTILTIGALLATTRPVVAPSIIPILWAAVGGSAAFLLRMPADLMLPLAAFVLIAELVLRPPVRNVHAARPLP